MATFLPTFAPGQTRPCPATASEFMCNRNLRLRIDLVEVGGGLGDHLSRQFDRTADAESEVLISAVPVDEIGLAVQRISTSRGSMRDHGRF